MAGIANPKSSTGRLDVFTRLIVDGAQEFEDVPAGYQGPLYAEISPRTFSVLVRTGSRLNQLRIRRGFSFTSDKEMEILQEQRVLILFVLLAQSFKLVLIRIQSLILSVS